MLSCMILTAIINPLNVQARTDESGAIVGAIFGIGSHPSAGVSPEAVEYFKKISIGDKGPFIKYYTHPYTFNNGILSEKIFPELTSADMKLLRNAMIEAVQSKNLPIKVSWKGPKAEGQIAVLRRGNFYHSHDYNYKGSKPVITRERCVEYASTITANGVNEAFRSFACTSGDAQLYLDKLLQNPATIEQQRTNPTYNDVTYNLPIVMMDEATYGGMSRLDKIKYVLSFVTWDN